MKKKYLIVSVISVLIMMIGFSFAYFTREVNGTGKEMSVSSKRLAIVGLSNISYKVTTNQL